MQEVTEFTLTGESISSLAQLVKLETNGLTLMFSLLGINRVFFCKDELIYFSGIIKRRANCTLSSPKSGIWKRGMQPGVKPAPHICKTWDEGTNGGPHIIDL